MRDKKELFARRGEVLEGEQSRYRMLSILQKVARTAFEETAQARMFEAGTGEPHLFSQAPGVTTIRFRLIGTTLPRIEDALRISECFRQAVMSVAGQVLGKNRIPAVLSGHGLPTGNRHGHAFYLSEDADGDGSIDHLAVFVPGGLDQQCHCIVMRLTRLWNREGQEWRILLAASASSPIFATARIWTSITPYLHPWYVKKNFTIEDQIRRECRERGLPELRAVEFLPTIKIAGRERTPLHFHRFRSKRGLVQPDTHGSFMRIEFATPISGPIALGFGCHFGLGMFVPIRET